MKKIDPGVRKETQYIACWVVILSVLLQAVFLVIGRWTLPVLFGNLLSAVASILNFLGIGFTVQRAVEKEEKDAKQLIKLSGMVRTFLMFLVLLVGVLLPVFSTWTVLIPLIFPRIAIAFRPLLEKKGVAPSSEEPRKEVADEHEE